MGIETYRVVVQGVEPGKDPETALRNLAASTKQRADALRPLLASNHVVIATGVDRDTALRYQHSLRKTGWLCAAEIEAVPVAAAPAPLAPATAGTAPPRKRSVIAAIAAMAAIMVIVAWVFLKPPVPVGVDGSLKPTMPISFDRIVGKWNCGREDAGNSSDRDIYVFADDGKFSATGYNSLAIEFSGTYRQSGDRLSLTIEGGSVLARHRQSLTLEGGSGLAQQGKSTTPPWQASAGPLYRAATHQGDSTIVHLQVTARIVKAAGDDLSFDLPALSGADRIVSCTRL